MSDENFVDPNTDDLDAFSDLLHGHAKEVESAPPASEEEGNDTDVEIDAPLENDHEADEQDTDNQQDEDEQADEEQEPEPENKKPKSRLDKRIGELLERERLQKERADALEARLNNLEQVQKPKELDKPVVVNNGPTPDDKTDDGTDKYPLGEFDPNYIADLTKHQFAEAWKQREAEEAQRAEELKVVEAKAALEANWNSRLEPALERYPDFQEKGEDLVSTFEGLEDNYSNYLTATLQSMEFGPDVLYYLANNVDEAKRIVGLGATGATIALGRIEAKFAFANEEKQNARPKVSKAPTPPPTNRGAAVSTPSIPPDTDDLDAFSTEFFKGKKR